MPDPYREAQIAARSRVGGLAAAAARQVQLALFELMARMTDQLKLLPAGAPAARRLALKQGLSITRSAYAELGLRIEQAVSGQRLIAFRDIYGIWRQAGRAALSTAGVPGFDFGAVTTPPVSILGAFENLGGAALHWKTALRSHITNARDEANAIVRNALANGIPARELARRLRPYVQGAEEFHVAFGGDAFKKVRQAEQQLPTHLRGAARRMRHNARRIAESEISNARAEAELQSYAQDPLIDGILWRTARSRGKTRIPDICNVLEDTRLYTDRPPGFFPLAQVPLPPHPFDRCERRPFVRPVAEAGRQKQNPKRSVSPNQVTVAGATPAREKALRRELATLLTHTDRHEVQDKMRGLITASQAEGRKLVRIRRRVLDRINIQQPSLKSAPAPVPVIRSPFDFFEKDASVLVGHPYENRQALAAAVKEFIGPKANVKRYVFDSPQLAPHNSIIGTFDPIGKDIHFHGKLSAGFDAIVAGEIPAFAYRSLITLLHETLHSTSPIIPAEYSIAAGWFFEEGIVEYSARTIFARAVGKGATYTEALPFLKNVPTGYPDHERAIHWLEQHFGREVVMDIWERKTALGRGTVAAEAMGKFIVPLLPPKRFRKSEIQRVRRSLSDFKFWFQFSPGGVLMIDFFERLPAADRRGFLKALHIL